MPSGFFPAVERDAPVHPLLQELWPAVRAETERYDGPDVRVHAELRAEVAADGTVERARFYWSTQYPDPGSPLGFGARTLYAKGTADPRLYTFPDEPVLTWLGDTDSPLRSDGRAPGIEILRYIPLRRVTCRVRDGAGLPASVIAKTKRTGGLNRAATAFRAAEAAAEHARADVPTVPRLLRVDPERHVLYLEELPGEPLNIAIDRLDLTEAMEQLGTLHRALQELDVRDLPPRRGAADWLRDARHATTQIGLFVPSAAPRAEAVYATLERTAPEDGRPLFCQGDFLPGQILAHPSGWSVIDFDDSRYADPLSEVAALYAALPRELGLPPELAETARRTYLEAYSRRAGEPLHRDRWRWFLVLVQLADLAKRLVKGRAAEGDAGAVLERLAGRPQDVLG